MFNLNIIELFQKKLTRRKLLELGSAVLTSFFLVSCSRVDNSDTNKGILLEKRITINNGDKNVEFLIEEEKIKKLFGDELYEVFLTTLNTHVQAYSCPIGQVNIQVERNTNIVGQLAVGDPGKIVLVRDRLIQLISDYNRLPEELKRISGGIETVIRLITSHELFHACKPDVLVEANIELPEYKIYDFWGRPIAVKINGFKGPAIYLSRSDGKNFVFAEAEESMAEFLARKLHLKDRNEVTEFIIADQYNRGVSFLNLLEREGIITQQDVVNLFYTSNLPTFLKKFFNLSDESELNSSHYHTYMWLFSKVWNGEISTQKAVSLVMSIRDKRNSSIENDNISQNNRLSNKQQIKITNITGEYYI